MKLYELVIDLYALLAKMEKGQTFERLFKSLFTGEMKTAAILDFLIEADDALSSRYDFDNILKVLDPDKISPADRMTILVRLSGAITWLSRLSADAGQRDRAHLLLDARWIDSSRWALTDFWKAVRLLQLAEYAAQLHNGEWKLLG